MADEEKKRRNLSDIVKENIQKLTIISVSVVYVAQGLFSFERKNATLLEVIGSIFLSIIVGAIISFSLDSMGITDGRRSTKFLSSVKLYGETKELATPHFDKIQSWCDYKNSVDLESKRKEIIQNAGLKWKLYKVGYYEKHEPSEQEQKDALVSAKKCKIERLTPSQLLSDLPSERYMKTRFGESEQDFKVRGSISDIISRTLIGIVCGMYGLAPLFTQENFEEKLANVVWCLLQIAIWITFGIMRYAKSKSFIEDEYRQTHIIQKTELLKEFICICEKNPAIIDEYDEDEEIDKYLEELKNEQKINN